MYNPDEDYRLMLERLKSICKQKNKTQYAIAKRTGISTSSMSNLMKGDSRPYLYTMLLICDALDISIRELFESNDTGGTAEEEQIITAYRIMSPEKRRALKIYADMLQQYNGMI